MAASAGKTIFVASQLDEDGKFRPKGALQVVLADVHGDPELLRREFASFQELTSAAAWRRSRAHGGDTAVLLHITVFARDERGGGLGTVLRNAVLHMLPKQIKYGLTMTPIESEEGLDLADAKTFTPAMRFHARGGALPTVILPAYKKAPPALADARDYDIAVMRYARAENGEWPVPRPAMSLRLMGPFEESLQTTVRRLKANAWPRAQARLLAPTAARLHALPATSRQVFTTITHPRHARA